MKQPKIPKYPFRKVGPAEKPSHNALKSLARTDCAAGPGKLKYRPSQRFHDREKALAMTEKPVYGIRPPKWLLARIARHASVTVVIEDLLKRLRRAPTRKAILFTQCGLNELGRRRGGGALLRRIITQKLVDEFQAKGEE